MVRVATIGLVRGCPLKKWMATQTAASPGRQIIAGAISLTISVDSALIKADAVSTRGAPPRLLVHVERYGRCRHGGVVTLVKPFESVGWRVKCRIYDVRKWWTDVNFGWAVTWS
jgi:hypothetical protein